MTTAELIEQLSRDARPVPRHTIDLRVGGGMICGAAATLIMVIALVGIRPDVAPASMTTPFWVKAAYAACYGLLGYLLVRQLATPETQVPRGLWIAAVPAGLLMIGAVGEWNSINGAVQNELLVQKSWRAVPIIVALAVPVYAGVAWAFGRLAPTKLWAAGAAAGLASGGIAATLFSLTCQEVSPTYLLTRFTAAIAIVVAAGAIAGPRMLRW